MNRNEPLASRSGSDHYADILLPRPRLTTASEQMHLTLLVVLFPMIRKDTPLRSTVTRAGTTIIRVGVVAVQLEPMVFPHCEGIDLDCNCRDFGLGERGVRQRVPCPMVGVVRLDTIRIVAVRHDSHDRVQGTTEGPEEPLLVWKMPYPYLSAAE